MYNLEEFIHSNGFGYMEKSIMRLINSNPEKYHMEEEILFYGVMTSDPHMVKFALTMKADPNYKHVISYAAHNGDNVIVLSLINAGAEIMGKLRNVSDKYHGTAYSKDTSARNLLSVAMECCSVEVIKKLLQKGLNPYDRNNFGNDAILDAGNIENLQFMVKYIMKDLMMSEKEVLNGSKNFKGDTILHRAVINCNLPMVEYASNFIDVNSKNNEGKTPLFGVHCAEVAKILVDKGAKFNILDENGIPAFHYITDENVLDLFLKLGCDINIRDFLGRSKLFSVIGMNDEFLFSFLMERKAEIKIYDRVGITPLHVACYNKNFFMIEKLLEAGANMDDKDNRGNNCLYYLNMSNL
jgi:ankyrin repeat protein